MIKWLISINSPTSYVTIPSLYQSQKLDIKFVIWVDPQVKTETGEWTFENPNNLAKKNASRIAVRSIFVMPNYS